MDRFLGLLHGLFAWPLFLASGLAVFVVVGVGQLLLLPFDRNRDFGARWGQRVWGRVVYGVQPLWHLHWQGVEQVGAGPYVVVSNHASMMDIPSLLNLPLSLRIVARRSLFHLPFLGWFMGLSRQIPMDSEHPAQALVRCAEELRRGISVLIFPEGTRSADGSVGRFRVGAFNLAFETGTPILVCSVEGTRMIMPRSVPWPQGWSCPVQARVLGILEPSVFEGPREMAREARRRVVEALSQG